MWPKLNIFLRPLWSSPKPPKPPSPSVHRGSGRAQKATRGNFTFLVSLYRTKRKRYSRTQGSRGPTRMLLLANLSVFPFFSQETHPFPHSLLRSCKFSIGLDAPGGTSSSAWLETEGNESQALRRRREFKFTLHREEAEADVLTS